MMFSRLFPRAIVASLVAVLGMSSGCGGDAPGPSAPSAAPVAPPTILTVSPSRGSTGGGTSVAILGSGFQSGVTVKLGAERQSARLLNNTSILMTTTAHDPGAVEIVVTNPDGQSARVGDGYSYASPQSFDFNGAWEGYAVAHPETHLGPRQHSDMEMRFTIERNMLTSFTCGGATLALSSPHAVSDGAFAHAGDGGVVLTGRIAAEGAAVGTINTNACPATWWTAARR